MKKRNRGIEQIKSRYGWYFVLPWTIGFILFFAVPVFQSLWYSLSDVILTENGIKVSFSWFSNYRYLLLEDPTYLEELSSTVGSFLYSLPFILLISAFLALILNQRFHGRLFFRALYFLPVIIATGIVMDLVFMTTDSVGGSSVSESITGSMFSVADVIRVLDLPVGISSYVEQIINSIFDLIWSCGVQTVLFIAGLQSIPSSLYEASRVEGATKWEEFWFITFPMLSRVTLLVGLYTMIELFTNSRNPLIGKIYTMMKSGTYDVTSSMLWLYFLIIGILMGILVWLYNRFLDRRWQ